MVIVQDISLGGMLLDFHQDIIYFNSKNIDFDKFTKDSIAITHQRDSTRRLLHSLVPSFISLSIVMLINGLKNLSHGKRVIGVMGTEWPLLLPPDSSHLFALVRPRSPGRCGEAVGPPLGAPYRDQSDRGGPRR